MTKLYNFFHTLFHHCSIIAELQRELACLEEMLINPMPEVPLPSERASKDNAPVRFKRSSYAEAMSTWEYEHNTKLKTELEKRQAGFL